MTDVRNGDTEDVIVFDLATGEPPVAPEERTHYTFGPYRLIRLLGKGGMASVFLVERRGAFEFRKTIALKIISPHIMREREQRQMFVDEVRLGGMLQHPHIVQMFDCGIEGAQSYCAMEFVDGWTFECLLTFCRTSGTQLPTTVVAEIVRAVCDGLHYAHTYVSEGQPLNLVHRDVKPANVLISRHGEVKVADFGIAKATTSSHDTQTGIARGTPAYMSPEQTLGRSLDCRSDVFSVGAMLFAALTGTFAFGSDDEDAQPAERAMTAMMAVMNCNRERAERVLREQYPAFLEVFMRATEKTRDDRYASAEAMGADLFSVATHLEGPTLREWLRQHAEALDESQKKQSVSPEELSLFQVTTVTPSGPKVARAEQIGRRRTPKAGKTRAFPPRRRAQRMAPWTAAAFVIGALALALASVIVTPVLRHDRRDVGGGDEASRTAREPSAVPAPEATPTLAQTPAPHVVERPEPTPRPTTPQTTPSPRTPAPTPRVVSTPHPAVTTFGTVTLASRPTAEVRVDGKAIGNTPRLGVQLSTGPHRIEFVCTVCGDEPKTEVREVTIIEGDNNKIVVNNFSD